MSLGPIYVYTRGTNGNDVYFSTTPNPGVIYDGLGGNDFIIGGRGIDYLAGSGGNDFLYGGANDDFISGGSGIDVLFGGSGNDTFIFDKSDFAHGEGKGLFKDTVLDFHGAGGYSTVGEQDFVAFTGFSGAAKLTYTYDIPFTGGHTQMYHLTDTGVDTYIIINVVDSTKHLVLGDFGFVG